MLENTVVLITGASSGIGLACAELFAKAGAKLILCARKTEKLRENFKSQAYVIELDIKDQSEVKKQLSLIPDNFKPIHILINNAGLAAGLDLIQDADTQDWEEMIDTNMKGLLYVTRAILPNMVVNNIGHIINIGSISGHAVYAKGVVYCATKYAVKAISEGLRHDLLGTKIRVSEIDTGAVETNFSVVRFKGDKKRASSVYEGFDPLTARDIADAVLYCATRPSHVNVSQMIITPTDQVSVNVIAKKH